MQTVENFNRIGEENAFAVLARAGALAAQGMDVINLGIGQPDFPTPKNIVEAAVKALRDGQHGYTPATGIPQLREAVSADLHRRFSAEVNPDKVLIVPGGKVTMFTAILMFGEPGAEILYPDPGFPIYRSMIEFTGAIPVPIPIREENGFAFSAEETLGLITDKTRLVIVNSPANPCGGVTPKAEIDALVAGLPEHVAIMSDEIYDQMLYDGEEHVTLLGYPEIRDRLILLNGWSKTYAMTGWRMGYSVWPKNLYDMARKLAVNAWSCVNAPFAIRRAGGADRAAGCRHSNGRRIRYPTEIGGGFDERPSGRFLHHAERRVLCVPQHFSDGVESQKACLGPARTNRRRHHWRPGFRHPRRRLYQGLFNLTDFRPVAACDGCDGLRSCDEVVPGLAPRVENRVICVERPVCEPCLAEILPNVFGWIQLW